MPELRNLSDQRLEEDLNDAMVRRHREDKLIADIEHELRVRKAREIHNVGAATADADIPPAA